MKIDGFVDNRLLEDKNKQKRVLALEQTELILYLISEILENPENHKKLEKNEVANLMKSAPWFTKYVYLDSAVKEDNFQTEKRQKFIDYLSQDLWYRIYNRPYII